MPGGHNPTRYGRVAQGFTMLSTPGGIGGSHPLPDASDIEYDNDASGLIGDTVQEAIDELAAGSSSAGTTLQSSAHGSFWALYHRNSDNTIFLMRSDDGIVFDDVNTAVAVSVADPSFIHWDGWWWMVVTANADKDFALYKTQTPETGAWTLVDVGVDVDAAGTNCWAPEWVHNPDGSAWTHPTTGYPAVMVALSTDSETTFTIRELHPTNRGMTSWSSAVTVTGSGLPSRMIDAYCVVVDGTFYLWFKDEADKMIEVAQSASLTSGYTMLENGDWASWSANKSGSANSIEGPCIVRLDDGRWRIYINENNGFSSIRTIYSDTTDDWTTGTSTWSANAVITTDELMGHGSVIWIPGVHDHARDPHAHPALMDSIVLDHGGLTGLSDDDHGHYLNEARHDALDHSAVPGVGLIPVDTGTVAYDDSGDEVEIDLETVWGYDGTDGYYDSAGAVAGEEAALYWDPDSSQYVLVLFAFP